MRPPAEVVTTWYPSRRTKSDIACRSVRANHSLTAAIHFSAGNHTSDFPRRKLAWITIPEASSLDR